MPRGLPATVRAAYEDRTPRPVHTADPDRLRGHVERPILNRVAPQQPDARHPHFSPHRAPPPAGQAEPAHRPANFISGYESMRVRFSLGPAIGHS